MGRDIKVSCREMWISGGEFDSAEVRLFIGVILRHEVLKNGNFCLYFYV
jgi:hypothetical protein